MQDNWKVNDKLTLDYGIRFVHATPLYDKLLQGGNFLPDQWSHSVAPMVYVFGCTGASPCSGTNRQAMNPLTGQLLGPNTTAAVGTLVPGSGNESNGLFSPGQGIAKTGYTFPKLVAGPRFGMAYDLDRQAEGRDARGDRHVFRSGASGQRTRADPEPLRARNRAVFTAAEPHRRRIDDQGRADDRSVRVQRQAANRDGVEFRCPGDASVGHGGGRRLHRPP